MEKGYNAIDIAKWFIFKTFIEQSENVTEDDDYEVYEGITHLKLQKLLYFAQGLSLALDDEKIFSDNIYAWPHGPVVGKVYSEFSKYGRNEIQYDSKWNSTIENINKDAKLLKILELTYDNFAGYTAWQLREKSHVAGGPWQITVSTKGMDAIISDDLIQKYFLKNVIGK